MSEENKIVTNKPEETLENYQMKMQKPHDNKMSILLIVTILLGMVSLFSLFFVLKNDGYKQEPTKEMLRDADTTEETDQESDTEELEDDELGTKKLIQEIETTDFEEMLNNFSDQKLDENLE